MTDIAIRASFIPLVDAAPLIIAKYQGFDQRHGLSLSLHRSTSWAGLRDRLSAGLDQCAHMLAPIPVASQIGLGNPKAAMIAACGMSMNGNAISMSRAVCDAMRAHGWSIDNLRDPAASAKAFAQVVRARVAKGEAPLTLASVYPISSHAYELRYWLASAGLDPDADVNLTVVPPPQIVAAVEDGHIDGFCVGAPWNSVSAASGVSELVALKVDILNPGLEKVLALREDWAAQHPETVYRLIAMLVDASSWCADPTHHGALAQILSADEYLSIPADLIYNSLSGDITNHPDVSVSDYLVLDPERTGRPNPNHGLWFYSQMVRWGQIEASYECAQKAKKAFISDYYQQAMGLSNTSEDAGHSASKSAAGGSPILAFDGQEFSADSPVI